MPTSARRPDLETIRYRIRLCCIWSWLPCVVLFAVAFGGIAGFIPPTGEDWSAQRIVEFYAANRTGIRIGLIASMFATALLLPFYATISEEITKIEGLGSLLARVQFGGAVVLTSFFQIICLLWLLASFRPEADPGIVQAATDYGWLVWTILIPTLSMQWICMAIASFIDYREQPLWPRWAGYTFIWVAITNAGGICAAFFKTGPFSWNGLVGWWIPTVSFALVMSVAMVLMRNHAVRERALSTGASESDVPVPAARLSA